MCTCQRCAYRTALGACGQVLTRASAIRAVCAKGMRVSRGLGQEERRAGAKCSVRVAAYSVHCELGGWGCTVCDMLLGSHHQQDSGACIFQGWAAAAGEKGSNQ